MSTVGPPPLARERHNWRCMICEHSRTTPADAGKTYFLFVTTLLMWDHPRWRGKDDSFADHVVFMTGSPPLARERRTLVVQYGTPARITPAGAGKTCLETDSLNTTWDHPRWRGKDFFQQYEP